LKYLQAPAFGQSREEEAFMSDPTLLAGAVLYASLFWMVCWRYPAVALMMIFGSAPFQNDLSGGGGGARFSFAEINLILALPIFLLRNKRLSIGPIAWAVAAYLSVCIISSVLSWRGGVAINSFVQMFLFMVVIVMLFASMTPKIEDVRLALCGVIPVALFIAVMLLATRQQYVLGIHKNGLGGSLSVSLLVCLELWFTARAGWRKWLLLGCLTIIAGGLVITLSRGSWVGAMMGIGLIFAMRRQWTLLARASIALIPVLILAWSQVPQEQREYATSFSKDRFNIQARYKNIDATRLYFSNSPIIGTGVGLRKQLDATNLAWMTLAETGVLGLITLAAVHVVFFRMIWRTQAQLDRGDPLYSLVAIGGALILARLTHGMVDHYWARGPTMMGWAAAGMATGVYFALQAREIGHQLPANRSARVKALAALTVIETERRRNAGKTA
jgi:hypothetical protein